MKTLSLCEGNWWSINVWWWKRKIVRKLHTRYSALQIEVPFYNEERERCFLLSVFTHNRVNHIHRKGVCELIDTDTQWKVNVEHTLSLEEREKRILYHLRHPFCLWWRHCSNIQVKRHHFHSTIAWQTAQTNCTTAAHIQIESCIDRWRWSRRREVREAKRCTFNGGGDDDDGPTFIMMRGDIQAFHVCFINYDVKWCVKRERRI